mmetsp:Transcript_126963/g.359286  ORF Transcript_126963/g.359286 Transcript_126963/m.359286 type:complete len:371 (+) Transcript_126963:675-1787(+)
MRAGALRDAVQRRTLPGRAHDRRLRVPRRPGAGPAGVPEPADPEAHPDAQPPRERADQGHDPVRGRGGVWPLHLPAPDEPHPHGPDREVVPDHHPQLPALLLGEPEEPAPALRHPEHHRAGHHDPVRRQHPARAVRQPQVRAEPDRVAELEVHAADVRGGDLQHERLPPAAERRHPHPPRLPGPHGPHAHLHARAPDQDRPERRLRQGPLLRLDGSHAAGRVRGPARGEQGTAPAAADVGEEHAAPVHKVEPPGLGGARLRSVPAPRRGGPNAGGRRHASGAEEEQVAAPEEQEQQMEAPLQPAAGRGRRGGGRGAAGRAAGAAAGPGGRLGRRRAAAYTCGRVGDVPGRRRRSRSAERSALPAQRYRDA